MIDKINMDKLKEDMHFGASPLIFERAKEMRHRMTRSEELLWEELKGKKLMNLKFRRQHPIMKFILDFYCHSIRLGIELDGKFHDGRAQQFYDEDRTEILNEKGIEVLRFKNSEVINEMEEVINRIRIFSESRRAVVPPSGG